MSGRHSPSRGGPGRRAVAVAVALSIVMAIGVGLVAFALTRQDHPPQVPLSSPDVALQQESSATVPVPINPSATPRSSSSSSAATPSSSSAAAPVAVPASVSIASIGTSSSLLKLGLDPDGKIAVPGPTHTKEAAWFTGSPRPGQVGPAVIEGHVDGPGGVQGVFFRLAAVQRNDTVQVTQANGRTLRFVVYAIARYPKDSFPAAVVYGNTKGPELRVITCGGSFDAATGHYRDNTVLFARLAG